MLFSSSPALSRRVGDKRFNSLKVHWSQANLADHLAVDGVSYVNTCLSCARMESGLQDRTALLEAHALGHALERFGFGFYDVHCGIVSH